MKLEPNTNHTAVETVEIVPIDPGHYSYSDDEFTVYVGDHRILTVATEDYNLAAKWISEVSKTLRRGPGVVAATLDARNHVLHLSTGCNALLCYLPHEEYRRWRWRSGDPPVARAFAGLVKDERVTLVGPGMAAVKEYLNEKWDLEVKNAVDLGAKAEELMPGAGKLSLEEMSTVFLRKDIDLEIVDDDYFGKYGWRCSKYTEEKVESATVEVYLAYEIGVKLIAAAKDKSLLSTFRWKYLLKEHPKPKYSLKPHAEQVEGIVDMISEEDDLLPSRASVVQKGRGKRNRFKSKGSLKAYDFGYEYL